MSNFIQKLSLGLVAIVAFVNSLLGGTMTSQPETTPPPQNILSQNNNLSPANAEKTVYLFLSSPKIVYSLKEEIPIEVIIQGKDVAITAVQMRIKYDSNVILKENAGKAIIPALNYTPNKNLPIQHELQIAALLRDIQTPYKLSGDAVFTKFTLKPTKTGRAVVSFGSDTAVVGEAKSPNKALNLIKQLKNLELTIVE